MVKPNPPGKKKTLERKAKDTYICKTATKFSQKKTEKNGYHENQRQNPLRREGGGVAWQRGTARKEPTKREER